MTPKRKAWWDSLPKEEKRIRQIYRYTKKEILNFTDHDKKYVIKALRKQIAMWPLKIAVGRTYFIGCPKCKQEVCKNYCENCGQKLRWE